MADMVRLEQRPDGIAVLTFDAPGRKVNTLGRHAFDEIGRHLDVIETTSDLLGLLIRSGKPGQFVAGAELSEVRALSGKPVREAAEFVQLGVRTFARIARLEFPTACVIDGPCLGGGAELALATDCRIFSNRPRTKFGFPEVGLGLIPSWGGTQRLTRLIGVRAAIALIADEEQLDAEGAVAAGIGMESVSEDDLLESGLVWLKGISTTSDPRIRREGGVTRRVADLIRAGASRGLDEAIALESKLAAELMASTEAGERIDDFYRSRQK